MITLRKHHYCLKTYFPWQTLYVHAVFVLARNVDAISTSPMSELCELRRLRALEDSRLSPATPRHAKPSKEARPPKLLYFDGTQWRGTRRAQARLGRKSMAEREKRKRWLRKPCMARLKGVFFRFLKRVWRPTNGLPTVGPSFCPSVRRQKFSAAWLSAEHTGRLEPFFQIRICRL